MRLKDPKDVERLTQVSRGTNTEAALPLLSSGG